MRAKMIDCCDCLVKIALSLRVRWHCERHLIDPPIDFFEARKLIYSQAMSTPNDVVRSKSDPKGSRRMCELEPYQTVAYSIAEVSGTMACQPQATATATTIQFSQFSHVCLSSFSPLSPSLWRKATQNKSKTVPPSQATRSTPLTPTSHSLFDLGMLTISLGHVILTLVLQYTLSFNS